MTDSGDSLLRVMLVITKGEIGGAQTHLIELCRALQGSVAFRAVIGGADPHSHLDQQLQALGIAVVHLPHLGNSLNPWHLLRSVRALRAQLQKDPPDLIHAHSAMAGVIARMAGKLARLPVVYTVHGFGFKPQAQPLIRLNAWLAEASMAAWTTRMICVSAHEQQLSLGLPIAPERVKVIRNAVADSPHRCRYGQTPVRVVMVSRMAAPKRPDLLIDALSLLAQEGLCPPTRLLGGGPRLEAMRERIASLGLAHIEAPGDVRNTDEQLAAHEIFVLLSDHEGLPISIIEAMRAGQAILASQLPGVQELITHGHNGCLTEADPAAIAKALRQLLQDGPLRERLGRQARQDYETFHRPEPMAREVLQTYQEARLQRTASLPFSRPGVRKRQLSTQTSRHQHHVLFWGLLGLLPWGLALALSEWMQAQGWVTYVFGHTVLASLLPYAVALHWHYRSARIPAAERNALRGVTTSLAYLLMPLAFALMQQAYSRGALVLTWGLTLLWFWLADRLALQGHVLRLLTVDPGVAKQLQPLLQGARLPGRIELVPWPAHWQEAPFMPDCDGALIDPAAPASPVRSHRLTQLKLLHLRLMSPESMAESLTGRLTATSLSNELWQTDGNPAYDLFKRIMDLVLVLLLAPLWLPLGLLVGIAVRWDSPGPALYSQMRSGLNGQPFRIYKFRSMRFEPEQSAQFAQAHDPRITRLGHVLRKSRLDEIPQLWNVLRGDMSLIGPRPEQESFVREFAQRIPSYPYRHLVRPGITGWAQVQQGYAASEDETVVKLSYDLYYVSHYSLAMDLLIAFKTVRIVLTGHGAR